MCAFTFRLDAKLLTLGWVSVHTFMSCIKGHSLYRRGAAACMKCSRAELSYKADNGSSRASNLGAASAPSN